MRTGGGGKGGVWEGEQDNTGGDPGRGLLLPLPLPFAGVPRRTGWLPDGQEALGPGQVLVTFGQGAECQRGPSLPRPSLPPPLTMMEKTKAAMLTGYAGQKQDKMLSHK